MNMKLEPQQERLSTPGRIYTGFSRACVGVMLFGGLLPIVAVAGISYRPTEFAPGILLIATCGGWTIIDLGITAFQWCATEQSRRPRPR